MNQPNIVLIVADDMGYGDFGVFNENMPGTPTLDRLVAEGICLTQHYSASPVCAPARAGLLTGRYSHRTGAIDTFEASGLDRINLRETTIADLFQSHGYATGMVGKWHNGALDPRFHPNARGFDEFAGFIGGWQDYYQWRLDYNGIVENSDGRYLTDVLTEEATRFITRHAREPFFLYVAYSAPHFPLQAPQDIVNRYRTQGFSEGVSLIYAMIEVMDTGIARILETLEQNSLGDNTIVMFTSDNGPALNDWQGLSQARFNCGYNGQKKLVYEGGIRVPLVIRWPDGLDGERQVDDMVHFTDWLPTLMSAAEFDLPGDLRLDGDNALPILRGETARVGRRKRFWQWNRYTPLVTCNAAMRDGDWKLVRPAIHEAMTVPKEEGERDRTLKYHPEQIKDIVRIPEVRTVPPPPPPLLFNIADDPLEQDDLASTHPERTHRMLGELETWFEVVESERLENEGQ